MTAFAVLVGVAFASAGADAADRGVRLAGLAGCGACHTADGGAPYAGGHAIETPFGTFVGTNLTPSESGLAAWTFDDFERAMRKGKSPNGRAYWPAFPYASFAALTNADLQDLWAFLQAQEPVERPNEPHALNRGRGALGLWRTFIYSPLKLKPTGDTQIDRGQYLVEALGHCGECHTPRSNVGRLQRKKHLTGADGPPYRSPNITFHADGIGSWSDEDLVDFFLFGFSPDGDVVGSGMGHVIWEGTSLLDPDDLRAMVAYLRTIPSGPTSF